jgi:hypothetical protein
MQNSVLKIDPKDNVLIALTDLHKGERTTYSDHVYILTSDVPAKHEFGTQELSAGDDVVMYGVLVGRARHPIQAGEVLTTRNVRHEASRYPESSRGYKWVPFRSVSGAAANLPWIPQGRWAGRHAKSLVQWCRWFSVRTEILPC